LKLAPQRMVIVTLIGSNVANVFSSVLATDVSTNLFGSNGIGIAAGIMSFVILSFTDVIPKSLATMHNVQISLAVAPLMYWLGIVLTPLIDFFEFLIRMVPGAYTRATPLRTFTEEELKASFDAGYEDKAINEYERRLLFKVLDFNHKIARESMTPAKECVVVNDDDSIEHALEKSSTALFSKFPVVSKEGKALGITSFKRLSTAKDKNAKVKDIMSKCLFTPQDASLTPLLNEMFDKREDIALVVGDHDEFLGAITVHDLVEELAAEVVGKELPAREEAEAHKESKKDVKRDEAQKHKDAQKSKPQTKPKG